MYTKAKFFAIAVVLFAIYSCEQETVSEESALYEETPFDINNETAIDKKDIKPPSGAGN